MSKTTSAQLRYLRMTPRKVRRVADAVKGLSANEAEAQLLLQPRRAAVPLLKLLRSAVANAREMKLDVEKLVVKSLRVDQGPMLKRYLPRARGSASPLQKKMSHVALVLEETDKAVKPRYHLVVPKKEKKEDRARRKTKRPAEGEKAEKEITAPKKEKPGFMKRFFRRKSV